jgi:hypothetical protein
MSDALPLPPRPNIEQYKKLAKEFQRACETGDPGALRDWAARWAEAVNRLQGLRDNPDDFRDVPSDVAFAGTRAFIHRNHNLRQPPMRSLQAMSRRSNPVLALGSEWCPDPLKSKVFSLEL